jgi:mitochondrial fission protein ELM1
MEFRKSATQAFVSTYLSPFTPYNGLLLWHGVGVGKTCAAISSAENYRKFADSLVEEAKKTKKFLYFFTINNKEMDKFIQLASKYYEFAIERGCEESKIKLEELKVDKKFSKYFWS